MRRRTSHFCTPLSATRLTGNAQRVECWRRDCRCEHGFAVSCVTRSGGLQRATGRHALRHMHSPAIEHSTSLSDLTRARIVVVTHWVIATCIHSFVGDWAAHTRFNAGPRLSNRLYIEAPYFLLLLLPAPSVQPCTCPEAPRLVCVNRTRTITPSLCKYLHISNHGRRR